MIKSLISNLHHLISVHLSQMWPTLGNELSHICTLRKMFTYIARCPDTFVYVFNKSCTLFGIVSEVCRLNMFSTNGNLDSFVTLCLYLHNRGVKCPQGWLSCSHPHPTPRATGARLCKLQLYYYCFIQGLNCVTALISIVIAVVIMIIIRANEWWSPNCKLHRNDSRWCYKKQINIYVHILETVTLQ